MIIPMIALWFISALLILGERRIARSILYLALFSLFSAAAFVILGSPDVAMAEAAISGFTTIFFVVCFERYFDLRSNVLTEAQNAPPEKLRKHESWKMFNLGLSVAGAVLFIVFLPPIDGINDTLKYLYIMRAATDVGGENPVGAIILSFRVYDTLFEALMLVVSVVAVIHLSWFPGLSIKKGRQSAIQRSGAATLTLRLVCPAMLIFGIYLIANGHISAGGGFQGGLAVASFFVCRFLIYDIYDISIAKLNKLEEIIFTGLTIVAALVVFQGDIMALVPQEHVLFVQTLYLVVMNLLVGLKVACAFVILFYRYIGIERQD